jgi:hypothetical protein
MNISKIVGVGLRDPESPLSKLRTFGSPKLRLVGFPAENLVTICGLSGMVNEMI